MKDGTLTNKTVLSHAKTIKEWMNYNLHNYINPNILPPSIPDLNPLVYYIQGIFEKENNQCPYNTIKYLKSAITCTMFKIDEDPLIGACQNFSPNIEEFISVNGGLIKQMH